MHFEELLKVNVSDYIEKKSSGGKELSYLSWVYAWAEFKKVFPKAGYTIWKDERGLPYVYDEMTGYMCYVTVDNGEGESHEMWLPVMDGANKAMKSEPYKYVTKYSGEKTVEAASMFDVNKTIMRALVKCIAMFGLGLYIFAGEDLPEDAPKEPAPKASSVRKASVKQLEVLKRVYTGDNLTKLLQVNGISKIEDLPMETASTLISKLSNRVEYDDGRQYDSDMWR